MSTCSTCKLWHPDPHDNGMGACTGMAVSDIVEITTDSETPAEIYTHETFFCSLHEEGR